jgi:hypothetical protein
MHSLTFDQAARVAADLLKDADLAAVLGVAPKEASRLALAIVAGADIAPDLAADLLDRHGDTIRTLEHAAMNTTSRPEYEEGRPVVTFELDATTRNCLLLVSALTLVAAEPGRNAA